MNALNWQEFEDYMERMLSDFREYSLSDAVKHGLPVSTSMKMRRLKTSKELTSLRTKTVLETAKVVDKLNAEYQKKDTNYEKEFKTFLKAVIKKFIGRKTYSELFDLGVVTSTTASKLRKEKDKGNYYLDTIAKIINYLNGEDKKNGTT